MRVDTGREALNERTGNRFAGRKEKEGREACVLSADARKDVKPVGTQLGIENYPGWADAVIVFLRQDSDNANANAERVEAGEQQQKLRRQRCRKAGAGKHAGGRPEWPQTGRY